LSTYCRHVPGSGSSRRRRPGRFAAANDNATLENEKARFLGKTGALTELLKGLGKLDPEARKTEGRASTRPSSRSKPRCRAPPGAGRCADERALAAEDRRHAARPPWRVAACIR
jgi:hypothetical protein